MDHVGADLSLADEPGVFARELPYEEAVAFLKGRVPVTKAEWKKLEPKLRFRAFTIAKLAQYEAIDKVRQGLIGALEKGQGLAAFWDELEAKEAGSPYYWETVYRTNIQTVYNAGRKIQIDKTKPDFLQLIVIEDERTTKNICLPLLGLILPYTHAFWKTHWPPFHFNCRTTVRPIYKGSGEIPSGKTPGLTAVQRGFKAQSGFGRDPLDSGNYWMMLPEMFQRGLETGAISVFNFMDNVVTDYDKVWKGYKRDVSTKTGWVDVADAAKNQAEFPESLSVAKKLAGEGMKVKVLPQHNKLDWKNPDYLVDGQLFELKSPSTINAIDKALRKAQKQAPNIVLDVQGKVDESEVRRLILLRLNRKDSASSDKIKTIILINGNVVTRFVAESFRNR